MLGKYDLAVDDYESMIQIYPDDAEAYVRKAVFLFTLGRLEEAIHPFDQTVMLQNQWIANLLDNEKFEDAAKIHADLANVHNNRGNAYYQLGQTGKAIEDYDGVIQCRPRTAGFYVNRAFAYEVQNRNAESKGNLERATQLGFTMASLEQD